MIYKSKLIQSIQQQFYMEKAKFSKLANPENIMGNSDKIKAKAFPRNQQKKKETVLPSPTLIMESITQQQISQIKQKQEYSQSLLNDLQKYGIEENSHLELINQKLQETNLHLTDAQKKNILIKQKVDLYIQEFKNLKQKNNIVISKLSNENQKLKKQNDCLKVQNMKGKSQLLQYINISKAQTLKWEQSFKNQNNKIKDGENKLKLLQNQYRSQAKHFFQKTQQLYMKEKYSLKETLEKTISHLNQNQNDCMVLRKALQQKESKLIQKIQSLEELNNQHTKLKQNIRNDNLYSSNELQDRINKIQQFDQKRQEQAEKRIAIINKEAKNKIKHLQNIVKQQKRQINSLKSNCDHLLIQWSRKFDKINQDRQQIVRQFQQSKKIQEQSKQQKQQSYLIQSQKLKCQIDKFTASVQFSAIISKFKLNHQQLYNITQMQSKTLNTLILKQIRPIFQTLKIKEKQIQSLIITNDQLRLQVYQKDRKLQLIQINYEMALEETAKYQKQNQQLSIKLVEETNQNKIKIEQIMEKQKNILQNIFEKTMNNQKEHHSKEVNQLKLTNQQLKEELNILDQKIQMKESLYKIIQNNIRSEIQNINSTLIQSNQAHLLQINRKNEEINFTQQKVKILETQMIDIKRNYIQLQNLYQNRNIESHQIQKMMNIILQLASFGKDIQQTKKYLYNKMCQFPSPFICLINLWNEERLNLVDQISHLNQENSKIYKLNEQTNEQNIKINIEKQLLKQQLHQGQQKYISFNATTVGIIKTYITQISDVKLEKQRQEDLFNNHQRQLKLSISELQRKLQKMQKMRELTIRQKEIELIQQGQGRNLLFGNDNYWRKAIHYIKIHKFDSSFLIYISSTKIKILICYHCQWLLKQICNNEKQINIKCKIFSFLLFLFNQFIIQK